ncbi:unnamed protein product, partial [Larinioides sclopetarius]
PGHNGHLQHLLLPFSTCGASSPRVGHLRVSERRVPARCHHASRRHKACRWRVVVLPFEFPRCSNNPHSGRGRSRILQND